jgi:hypothetical protein
LLQTPQSQQTPQTHEDPIKAANQAIISDFFIPLTDLVTAAAREALNSNTFGGGSKDMCLLPKGLDGITRSTVPFCMDGRTLGYGTIQYNPRSVCFVGGAALHAYGLATEPVFGRNIMEKQKTTDIDAVWWPTTRTLTPQTNQSLLEIQDYSYKPLSTQGQYFKEAPLDYIKTAKEYLIVSSSPYIQTLATATAEQMKLYGDTFLEAHSVHLQRLIASYIPDMATESLRIEAGAEHIRMPGVWNVSCTLHIGSGTALKLVELAIHDGASSQKSAALEDKRSDLVYQTQSPGDAWDIVGLPVRSHIRNVPTLRHFMSQQWLALSNRVNVYWMTKNATMLPKILTHYLRIREIFSMSSVLSMYRSSLVAPFEKITKSRFDDLLQFVQMFVQNKWFNLPEWIAACPWTPEQCNMTPDNKRLLEELCKENKVLRAEVLCGSQGGSRGRKTRRRRRATL